VRRTAPLKRFLQRHVETKLARAFIAGEVSEGAEVIFTVQNEQLARIQTAHAVKNERDESFLRVTVDTATQSLVRIR
jgi:antitoxin (DNA-binding transcriptional repressor) of toxin-antitoxin stability system